MDSKGQLISKCPFGQKTSPKKTKKNLDFCPEICCSFLGASWIFWGLPVGFLVYNITDYVPRKPKKLPESPQEATKKFQGRNQEIFRWFFGRSFTTKRTF